MRLKLIACKVMCREISHLLAECENYIDVTYIKQGLHNEPNRLKEVIQHEIDLVDSGKDTHSCDANGMDFDALLIGFGLCSNGTAGIRSKRYKIVIPRAHDCAAILLGSAKKYKKIFDEYDGGVYWYSAGWVENCPMPCEDTSKKKYEEYKAKFGKDNAKYLIETEKESLEKYKMAAFIDTGVWSAEYADFTEKAAKYFGWKFKRYRANRGLLRDFLGGRWDDERFLVVPRGLYVSPSFDGGIVRAESQLQDDKKENL